MAIGVEHSEFEHYAAARPWVRAIIEAADEVWVSTAELARRVSALGGRAVVLGNELDDRLWPKPVMVAREGLVRILCMGTSTHRSEFEAIMAPVAGALMQEFGKKQLEFVLVGVAPSAPAPWRVVLPPGAVGGCYPAFCHWLQNLPAFDIGVAPLADTSFNQAKSHIKWLEYSAIGAATVASRVAEYTESIVDGETGMLTACSAEGFHTSLRELVLDRKKLAEIRAGAQGEAGRRLAYMSVAQARLQRLHDLAA